MKRCHSCKCRNLLKNYYLGQIIMGMPACAGMTIQPVLGILQQELIRNIKGENDLELFDIKKEKTI
jgi:hypothetical protein